jgi:hypothetical protein
VQKESDTIILSTEFSDKFIQFMKNRMIVSFYKYGKVADAYPHKVDAIGSMQERMRRYAETGNTEWLVDAANFLMIEFMHPRHPTAHFQGTDDDASPGRRMIRGGLLTKQNNQEAGTNPNSKTAKFK